MSAPLTAFIIFVFMLSGIALGSYFRLVLPDDHTNGNSKDILMTSAETMGMLIALIIGLLVTSAKENYDDATSNITELAARTITLDYYLSCYGSEAKEIRELLRQSVDSGIKRVWPDESTHGADLSKMESSSDMTTIYNKIRELSPKDDSQKYLRTQALDVVATLMQSRWMAIEQSQINLPKAFVVVLTFWLTILSVQFGLLAPRNIIALSALFICSLSMSSAIFLILELNNPLEGTIKVSSAPLYKTLSIIGK